ERATPGAWHQADARAGAFMDQLSAEDSAMLAASMHVNVTDRERLEFLSQHSHPRMADPPEELRGCRSRLEDSDTTLDRRFDDSEGCMARLRGYYEVAVNEMAGLPCSAGSPCAWSSVYTLKNV